MAEKEGMAEEVGPVSNVDVAMEEKGESWFVGWFELYFFNLLSTYLPSISTNK